ncbi:sirohydrochlorin chelatase [Geminisphaera colitermitum]|uniref:sirohydrochlorin chelatase n=1 Tax=Geminisphaera colitermitum TaxID=1148786 RepID=UPI000158D087|nr:CbiX/SirB N-terminal domain-containing protein [Geminisphaera colitermitum]
MTPTCFLFDNGSLRADATRALRALAVALESRIGVPVEAVSLLHSTKIPADQLDGIPARLLEPALNAFFQQSPGAHAVLLPLFFGPSGAVTGYLPGRVRALLERFPAARITQACWLVDPAQPDGGAPEIVAILADRVRAVIHSAGLGRPRVLLVDHGSPKRSVTAVRNLLGAALARELAGECAGVGVASMERREEERYDFNEPLLERALVTAPANQGDVVVALQFLSPGRHAGPGGDITQICQAAERANHGLRTQITDTLAGDPRLVEVLARRFDELRVTNYE